MTTRIITADEAKSMLDARESKGAWRVGTVEAEGKVWARDPEALGGDALGEVCVFNANTYRPHNGNRALAAAAPDLAHTVVAQAAEIDALKAQVDAQAVALRVVALWLGGPHHASDPESVSSLARAKGREIDSLRAIIDGRTIPPTNDEIAAHTSTGGYWMVTECDDEGRVWSPYIDCDIADLERLAKRRVWASRHRRWIAIRNGCPCAWPVVGGDR